MRRKDREITDFDEMMKIIAKCDTCRFLKLWNRCRRRTTLSIFS